MFIVNLYEKLLILFIAYISGWLLFFKPIFEIINCTNLTGEVITITILKLVFVIPIAKIIYMIGAVIALKIFK